MFPKLGFLVLTLHSIANSECARILGIVSTPSYSHQILFRPIWNELSRRGHELTVLTTDPQNDPSLTNLREIDLHGAYQFWNVSMLTNKNKYNAMKELHEMFEMMDMVEKYEMEHPKVQDLIKNEAEHFDLLIMEFLFPATVVFSKRFECPFIGVVSMDAPSYIHNVLGNPIHPVLYPEFQLPFVPPLNFFQRLVSTSFYIFTYIFGRLFVVAKADAKIQKYFGSDYPSFIEISRNISMMFVNTNPAFNVVRPLVPATIQIGGGTHITAPKKLPRDLKRFLNNAKEGVVFFSLGSNVKSDSIGEPLTKVFLDTFENLPYKVLWKFDKELEAVPENVWVLNWVPQQDVLRHPNIKLFITQGGLQSTEEAALSHVPLVVIPFFGDQIGNANVIKSKGFGLVLDKDKLDSETLRHAIFEVANNPKFREAAMDFAEILTDQPMTGTEKAVWWTEYVLRHKGAQHLRGGAAQLPLYQYFFLDVIAVYVTVVSIFVILVCKLSKLAWSTMFGAKRNKVKVQ